MRLVPLATPDAEVRGDRHIHHLRIGKIERVHDRGVLIRRRDLKPGVEVPLLADRADGVPLVVVTGVDQGLVGQRGSGPVQGGSADQCLLDRDFQIELPRYSSQYTSARSRTPSISIASPSLTRIETTSTGASAPITVTHLVRSRSAPIPLT